MFRFYLLWFVYLGSFLAVLMAYSALREHFWWAMETR